MGNPLGPPLGQAGQAPQFFVYLFVDGADPKAKPCMMVFETYCKVVHGARLP